LRDFDLNLDLGSGHTAHRRVAVSYLYAQTKLNLSRNYWTNFFWTNRRIRTADQLENDTQLQNDSGIKVMILLIYNNMNCRKKIMRNTSLMTVGPRWFLVSSSAGVCMSLV